jgi:hypothetical protein
VQSVPLSPDDRAMEQAELLKKNAGGVAMEAQVATLLAVPEEDRNPFTHGRARQAGTNAAIESTVLSTVGVVEAVPTLDTKQTGDYGRGWNAHARRVLDDLGRLRGALVAQRRRGFRTKAAPDTLLTEPLFVEALYLLWTLDSTVTCRWDIRTGLCTAHPQHTESSQQCDYNDARAFMERMGMHWNSDAIPHLWDEVRARREHAEAMAAEPIEEGDADAAQQ